MASGTNLVLFLIIPEKGSLRNAFSGKLGKSSRRSEYNFELQMKDSYGKITKIPDCYDDVIVRKRLWQRKKRRLNF